MARIGATISGIERLLINQLGESNAAQSKSLLRLATGQKINSPRDNPSAFLSLSSFKTELTTINAALSNVTKASIIVSNVELTLGQIRTQLDIIRQRAVDDIGGILSSQQRALNQGDIDAAVSEINRLAGTTIEGKRLLDGSANFTILGRNSTQVSNLTVRSVGGQGLVVAAKPAELQHLGTAGRLTSAATVTIAGNTGSSQFAFTNSQPLVEVARAINNRKSLTGVQASVSGDVLKLQSTSFGGDRFVKATVDSGTFAVTGGDSNGNATGVSPQLGTGPAISGFVTEAATQATVAHTGVAGALASNANITLTSNRGSATFSFTNAQTLASVATALNQKSQDTGVTAVANGDTLTLTSLDFGTKAFVDVDVTSGTFAVTGGDANGRDDGTNAKATINGINYQGNEAARSAELTYTGTNGQATQTGTITVAGNAGSRQFVINANDPLTTIRDAINLEVANTGVSASVQFNDLILTSTTVGANSTVQVTDPTGTFGFISTDNPNSLTSTPATTASLTHTTTSGTIEANTTFDLIGTGTASITLNLGDTLVQAETAINLQNGTTGITASINGNQLVLTTDATGSASQVQVSVTSGSFAVTGGNGSGTATGTDDVKTTLGVDAITDQFQVDGNRFNVNSGGHNFEIEFAPGFTGDFDTIKIQNDAITFALSTNVGILSQLPIPSLLASNLGGLTGKLTDLIAGGTFSGLGNNSVQAVRIADEAISQLTIVQAMVGGFANSTIASSKSLLEGLQVETTTAIGQINDVNVDEENLLISKNKILAENAIYALQLLAQQRTSLLDIFNARPVN